MIWKAVFPIMHDIETRDDILHLMRAFYARAMVDDVIGYIFTDVAHMDLEAHLPVITDFWESLLFKTQSYNGLPMQVHRALNAKSPFRVEHFERWLLLFHTAVDENFAGERATQIKTFADGIARSMVARLVGNEPDGVHLTAAPRRRMAMGRGV